MNQIPSIDFDRLTEQLSHRGLNLCAPISRSVLADSMPEMVLPDHIRYLLLIGSAGSDLWQSVPPGYFDREHPIDEYSTDCVAQALTECSPDGSGSGANWPDRNWNILFPGKFDLGISLQELGALVGWHHPSPLGIGINTHHGLWFAYRAVVAIEFDLREIADALSDLADADSPCLSCDARPCLSSCPADALEFAYTPDLSACVTHRLQPASGCASTCVARLVCPVAPRFKYADEQMAYFYNRSLESAKRWVTDK